MFFQPLIRTAQIFCFAVAVQPVLDTLHTSFVRALGQEPRIGQSTNHASDVAETLITTHLVHDVASRSEIERKYGKRETNTIEENAVVKQWFGFSSFEEAERVSRAMGETLHLSTSIGLSSDKSEFSGNYSTGKERLYTPDMLMRLPRDEQIIHVKDVGFIHAKKIQQNQIAPTCFELADNPLEGTRLPPEPIVDLSSGQIFKRKRWST